jgi:hypothetical protein
MAAHQVGIAKAAFAASLFAPDPSSGSVAKDEINKFHILLDAVILQCSPNTVQVCYKNSGIS